LNEDEDSGLAFTVFCCSAVCSINDAFNLATSSSTSSRSESDSELELLLDPPDSVTFIFESLGWDDAYDSQKYCYLVLVGAKC
jgi:hypothetical protein